MIEPPYGVIWDGLSSGQVVPFLGAGASLSGRPAAGWTSKSGDCLPTGRELADYLAKQSTFPSTDPRDIGDLAKVASYYSDVSGRRGLRQKLRQVFNRQIPVGGIHTFLASIPTPMVIVSTNYDTLIESAFDAAGRAYDVVVYPSDQPETAGSVLWRPSSTGHWETSIKPNSLDIDLEKTTVIFKMHGTVDAKDPEVDSFVITEEDYIEFLSRMTVPNRAIPSLLIQHFRERSFLFLGYGLADWNLRVVLRNISTRIHGKHRDDLPSWAIQIRPSELERVLWDRRNVNIFDMSIDDFVSRMTKVAAA